MKSKGAAARSIEDFYPNLLEVHTCPQVLSVFTSIPLTFLWTATWLMHFTTGLQLGRFVL